MLDNTLSNQYAGKNVLITGGMGFIGSNLAIRLSKEGAKVTILDSLLANFGGNIFNIKPIESIVKINISDMRDIPSLQILVQNQDYIFHLAGQVSHGDSMRDPEQDLAVNCVSTINLVEACRQFNPNARLVYTSTRQVYGVPKTLPVTEEHAALPVDVNGINKLAAEYYHLLYDRTYGLRSVVLRLTNTYGPRQQIRNNRQGFIGIFFRQALRNEIIKIFGTGNQLRDFNYVDDVVEAILLSAITENCYGKIFNLGAPQNYSLLQFLDIFKDIFNINYEIIPFPEDKKIIDIGDYYGDYSRFTEMTGWQTKIDLAEGIEKTINFYKKHQQEYWA
ncbi:NAD-dependent epimerase/dehydratase family protein [Lutibacter sp.]